MEIEVKLPDGSERSYPQGVRVSDILVDWDEEVSQRALAVKGNGVLIDLSSSLHEGTALEVVTFENQEGRQVYWHSAAHIMAQAVKQLFPEVKLAIGPPIDTGFYYDFEAPNPFNPEDLERIEGRMRDIVKANLPIERRKVKKEEAVELFSQRDEKYKLELLSQLDGSVCLYQQGDFVDLCLGPHLPSTGRIGAFKLLSISGAYWRGDESREMLQRIYGTAYETDEALQAHLDRLEEAKRRDHRKLGKELDLFSIPEEAGPGLVHWHPKGAILRKVIEDFWKDEHLKRGYELVDTPHIAKSDLWHQSGHYQYYRENMYVFSVEGNEYVLKPMNCPGHLLIYKQRLRSYRELPVRYAEIGTVYRHERSGVLHGMLRVRGFTIDDAHIFCTPEQVKEELLGVVDLAQFMMTVFGYSQYEVELSVRESGDREHYAGGDEDWEKAEAALAEVLELRGLPYRTMEGEAVFYGPKIDMKLIDALGRPWQGPTIQFDFNLPERFQLEYIGADNQPHPVVLVHRAILGSLERFVGGLVEHHGGALPLWLSPVQVRVLPITDHQAEYAGSIHRRLVEEGLRCELDSRNEKIGFKIREAEKEKIPYMLIIGEREVSSNAVSVRKRKKGDLGTQDFGQFLTSLKREVEERL